MSRDTDRNARPRAVRPHTLRRNELGKQVLAAGRLLYPVADHRRPITRAECRDAERPCLFVSCKWHLYLDVGARGSIKLNFPDLEPDELETSCALDVADRGGASDLTVARLLNVTRQGARRIEGEAARKIVEALRELV